MLINHFKEYIMRCVVQSGVLCAVLLLLSLCYPTGINAKQTEPALKVGSEIDFPPYAIVDDTGNASGFSVELIKEVAQVMGLSIEIHTGPWSEVLTSFKDGKTDILPLVALSKERSDMATYTNVHTVAYDSFFVRRGSQSISSLAAAKGKEIIVMSSDAAHEQLVASGVNVHIIETKTIPEAMRQLAAGKHDAVLVPKLLGHMVLKQLNLENNIESGSPIKEYNRRFAFAVQRGNNDLRDKLNQGISIVRTTGHYDVIYNKWFGGIEPKVGLPWRKIIVAISVLFLLLIIVLFWVLILRRQVIKRTAELNLERDKLKIILDTMEDGLYIVTREYNLDFINKTIVNEFGEVNNRKCYEYFHDRTEPCPWCKNEEVFSGKSVRWEWYSARNNKAYTLLDTPIKNVDGSVCKFEILHDISEVKQAQSIMKRELDFQAAMADVSETLLSNNMSISDISKTVNKQAMNLTNSLHGYVAEIDMNTKAKVAYTITEMIDNGACNVDTRYQRMTFSHGNEEYSALWGHALNTKQSFYTNNPQKHQAYKGCMPDGHILIKRFLSVPAMLGENIIGIIALANSERDYTDDDINIIKRLAAIYAIALERKRIENSLKEAYAKNKMLLNALDNSPAYLYIKDMDLRYVYANRLTLELFNCTQDELIGATDTKFFKAETLEGFLVNDRRVIEKGEIVETEEITIPETLGRKVVYWAVKRPIYDSEGKIYGLCGVSTDITQRKQFEEEISRVKEQLFKVMESTGDIIAMMDTEYHYMLFNTAFHSEFKRIFGLDLKQGDSMLKSLAELPDDLANALDYWNRALAGEDFIVTQQFGNTKLDRCWYDLHFSPVRDSEGRVISAVHVVRNVTERKRMEEELHAYKNELEDIVKKRTEELTAVKERFRTAFEFSTVGAAITSPDKGWIEVNGELCRMFGYSKDELRSMTWVEITHPGDIEPDVMQFNRVLAGEINGYNMEKRFIRKDGTIIYTMLLLNCNRSAYGNVEYFIAMIEDITERKFMEEKLRKSKLELDLAQRISRIGSWRVDFGKDGENWIVSDELYNIYEYPYDMKLTMQTGIDRIHPDDQEFVMTSWIAAKDGRGPNEWEHRIIVNDKIKNMYVRVQFIFDDNGIVKEAFGILQDITERKRMEEELRDLNNNLQAMIEIETEKRQQNEQILIQQSKMASMGEMIGLIAHQWKQPLNGIGLMMQDLEDCYKYGEVDDKYIGNLVSSTMQQIDFMAKTVDDFRNFFIPSKKKVLFDVKTAIEELLSMFIHIFSKNNIDISIKEQYQILSVEGYPNEFKQVILNILNNAKDAIVSGMKINPEIKGHIEITSANNEDKSKILISIKDNGGGIPDDVITRIFEPYFTTKEKEGTGIGLYMSKTIIETNMGGSLTVRNVDGGAEFVIGLDVHNAEGV